MYSILEEAATGRCWTLLRATGVEKQPDMLSSGTAGLTEPAWPYDWFRHWVLRTV